MKDISHVIKTIRLSEKATLLLEKFNEYVFVVHPKSNKIEIREAVEHMFGKKVIGVRTMNVPGKKKRKRSAAAGRTADWKKAIVRLKAGDKIDLV